MCKFEQKLLLMERRMTGNCHVRCGAGENLEIISKGYLSLKMSTLRICRRGGIHCFEAFNAISNNLTLDFSSGLTNEGLLMHIMQYATPVLCVIMLAVTVAKASEITKRALGS